MDYAVTLARRQEVRSVRALQAERFTGRLTPDDSDFLTWMYRAARTDCETPGPLGVSSQVWMPLESGEIL